eukprot:CAMPEP_0170861260 /NCGR_PEP_ID=MMETSP0734-20130129/18084_1 /TAXON_ID=186038 /ORGANISM="Fragilariopsis kerguelensis, Strain L26-C5" /LENGTH=120 /DNA_ID=CAMNT_0011235259 /DNA_START=137 /DNA_END=499 /DNA_ORIENTATION=+
MTPPSTKQYRRRSSCGKIALVAAAALTSTSAFTQSHYPRRSSTLLQASIVGQDEQMSRGSTVLDQSFNLINNPSTEKYLNNNKNKNKYSEQEEYKNEDDDEWELRLYDDKKIHVKKWHVF